MKRIIQLSLTFSFLIFLMSFIQADKKYLPTSLRITVIDGMGNFVEGAKVTLYASEDDFKKSENPVQEAQLTDVKGRVTFRDLNPQVYYVDVVKDKMTNYGGAQVTSMLAEKKMNKVNIVID